MKAERQTWDEYFLRMAEYVSTRSKDRSTKVGVVIVGPDHEVISMGYNGMPRGVNDDVESRHERPSKYMWFEHGERNAIFNAARVGVTTRGTTMYLNCGWPCADCARAIIQTGITRVVIRRSAWKAQMSNERFAGRWRASCQVGLTMMREANVNCEERGDVGNG